jgi:hypothetical protein
MAVVKSIVETVDGKKFELEHEDTVSDDVLSKYVQQVAYPMAAAEEDGPFDFIVDSLFSGTGSIIEGFETSAEGFQQAAANATRNLVNHYYNTIEAGAKIAGSLDAENAERLKVAREKSLRGVNQYEDVGVMMREPMRNLAKNIKDARFLQQDTAAANVALEVIDTVAKMAPVIGSAFTTKNVASVLPTFTAGAQAISEAKSDMEYSLGKKQDEFTLEERQLLGDVSTTYAAGSAILFKLIASPAIGLDRVSGDLLTKFLKGEVKLPAGKLKSLFNIVRAGGGEALEETAQGQFLDTLAAFSYDDDRQLVGKEVINKRMHEALIAFLAGGGIRTVGEVGGAIGDIRLPEPKTQELSEEQQKGVKTFKVKYTTTEKERGRQDKVFDREDTFEAKTLEEAQRIIDESVKKKPGVDAESIVIEEVQPTVEPEVKDDVDFIPDYSDARVGDTIKVFGVDGKESDVEVTGISDAGTIKYKRADGTEGILGSESDAVLYDINSSNYETQARNTGFSNRKLSDMSDAELEQLSNKIDEDFKSGAVPTDINQGPVRDRIADRNAVKLEQKRRKQKPAEPVIDEEPITEVTKIQQELAELADVFAAEMEAKGSAPEIRKQIQAKEAELKVAEEAQAKARQEARDAEVKAETDRILKEQKERIAQGKPLFEDFGVFSDVDLETTDLTPEQKAEIIELRKEAQAEAKKILQSLEDPTGQIDTEVIKKGLDALEDPTGAVDTQAVAEGLEALRQISEEGTVGATTEQKQLFNRIREIERRQAEVLGREYIPRTDSSIVREIERTIVRSPIQRGASGALFVGATDQQGKTDAQTDAERSIIGSAVAAAQKLAGKIGVKIEANTEINRPAQYNYETQTIQYNPRLLASKGKEFSKAAMREEVIHAAMHKVIMKRNPKLSAKAAFEKAMSSIGSSLTAEQKSLMEEAYGELGTDLNYGAEYTRFAVQHILDGKTTEGTLFGGKAYEKLKSLIKSVQSYVTKILGPELKANEEAAFIIADTLRLLRSVEPDVKPAQQKIVSEALAIASGTAQADSFTYTNPFASEADRKKINSAKNKRFAQSVLQVASSFFKNINMEIHNVLSSYYNRIERRQNDASRQILNFQKKIRGIKNKKDSVRLKQLLTASADPNTKEGKKIYNERDSLLRKYNLYNDFKLLVRPLLDNLRLDAIESNLPVKYLFGYYPRVVKDLGGLLNLYGKDIRNDFTAHIAKINKDRTESVPKKLELNTDEVAAEFIVYLNNQMYNQNLGDKVPSFLKKRKSGMLTQEELKFYEEPEVALGRYVNSIIIKSEQARLFGNKALERDEEILLDTGKIHRINLSDPTGELSKVVGRLYNEGKLSEEQMGDLFFGLDQLFGPPIPGKETERDLYQYGRIATYGSLLVDPTTTLSQLYDIAFMGLDNRLQDIARTVFGKKDFTLEMAGIDPRLASAEFRPNDDARLKFVEKLTRGMLRSVGFTQLDALMKETNLTVNYNRYRRLSKLSPNSSKFKKFRSEVEFMVGKEDADRTISDFRNGVYDSPYVRELVVRKLLETQPVTVFEMPMAIRKNPNLRMWYTMKSFIIKQANLINDRMISKILSKTSSGEEKRKAFMELFKLIILFQIVGFPIDFIKDMFAQRDVYPEDYVENAFLRMFGLSKYNIYEIRHKGLGEAALNFVLPVPLAQLLVLANGIQRTTGKVIGGEVETDDFLKLARDIAPYDSLWYYRYGPGVESQRKKREREAKDSTSIIESLIQLPSGRQEGRRPMIEGNRPIGISINELSDIIPYLRNR